MSTPRPRSRSAGDRGGQPAGATTARDAAHRGRVPAAHRQARASLRVALAFALAAPLSAALPHDTGAWLPVHLFLVGGVLSAISGATQLLAVTWSAAPAPRPWLAQLQRWLLVLGTVALVLARELNATPITAAIAGSSVLAALFVLAGLLWGVRRGATVDRFKPAIEGYLVAIALGAVGIAIGVLLATGDLGPTYGELRAIHVIVNLLGLVGLVIVSTLPYFIATQVRSRMSPYATSTAIRTLVITMAATLVVAAAATLVQIPTGVSVALSCYAVGVAALFLLVPRVGRRQLAWAGPRVVQLLAGLAWWTATTALLAWSAASTEGPVPANVVLALVVGGYAQIVVASFAYFGPVLRGGGHTALGAGFAVTRSWLSLVAGNLAAWAALVEWRALLVAALTVWILDVGWRAMRLERSVGPDRAPAT